MRTIEEVIKLLKVKIDSTNKEIDLLMRQKEILYEVLNELEGNPF